MSGERLISLSDMHFGSGDDLLRSGACLERLRPWLRWADTVVLNGDTWELLTGNLDHAINSSKSFFSMLGEEVDRIVFIPGNHDHHFVAQASDQERFSRLLGDGDEPLFRLATAERLVRKLTKDSCDVLAPYPVYESSCGVTFHHGHYITPHLSARGIGARVFDRLTWRLAGLERRKRPQLAVSDYEALMAPLHELLYQSAQLPSSAQTRKSGERFLKFTTKVLRVPGLLTKKLVTSLAPGEGEDETNPTALFQLTRPEEAAWAMVEVCRNLGIGSGSVCFGHSHAPFSDFEKDGWRLYNSGSWILDHREMTFPGYSRLAWPGVILRVEEGRVESHSLLSDLTLQELAVMTGSAEALRHARRTYGQGEGQ